jgi:hypothetical protein
MEDIVTPVDDAKKTVYGSLAIVPQDFILLHEDLN